jgi:hypothetical protein
MPIYSNADPVSFQPYLWINGFQVSNDATTPNSIIDVGPGLCRDSTNTFDINLGNYFGEIPTPVSLNNNVYPAVPAPNTTTLVFGLVNGALGLDTGTLAASSLYYVFVIADQTGRLAPSALISLSLTAPLLPAGYNIFRHISQISTDSSIHFVSMFSNGNDVVRNVLFNTPVPTSVTAGHATTYTNVNLAGIVPSVNNLPVTLYVSYTPATAGNVLSLQPGNGTGAITVTGQVATVPTTTTVTVLAQLVTIGGVPSPVINYKVTNASDTAVISVAGYQYSL